MKYWVSQLKYSHISIIQLPESFFKSVIDNTTQTLRSCIIFCEKIIIYFGDGINIKSLCLFVDNYIVTIATYLFRSIINFERSLSSSGAVMTFGCSTWLPTVTMQTLLPHCL